MRGYATETTDGGSGVTDCGEGHVWQWSPPNNRLVPRSRGWTQGERVMSYQYSCRKVARGHPSVVLIEEQFRSFTNYPGCLTVDSRRFE